MADTEMVDAPAEDADLSSPGVVEKYTVAGDIANAALQAVIAAIAPGKKIVDLCVIGDNLIKARTSAVYKSAKIEKGVAFPTCISVNHCCGHYSALEEDATVLNDGDLVKIDLGAHIDGFIAVVAHTLVIGSEVTGRKADVIAAANTAAEIALRTIKPGAKGSEVTRNVERVIAAYQCEPLDGVMSHQLKKFAIEGPKYFMNKVHPEKRVADITFEANEVYGVDIVVSSGDGRARDSETRVTVFKRNVDNSYSLKLKASRQLFHDVKEKHPHMPFSLREIEGKGAKMGVVECVKHGLLTQYPVMFERDGEFVAQFKYTVLVTAAGARRITGTTVQAVTSDKRVEDEELLAVLAAKAGPSKNKKKKKAATAAPAEGGASA